MSKHTLKNKMKKRIKNSQVFTNIKDIDDDGLINLKSGEVASLIEVKAIDLSLNSKGEKLNFFQVLKSLYQIRGLNLKCYKLDEKINLNANKVNLDKMIDEYIEKKNLIIGQIDSIENEDYYNILFSRYIEKKTFEVIATEMKYSWRQIIRLHGKALKAFEEKYGNSYLKMS